MIQDDVPEAMVEAPAEVVEGTKAEMSEEERKCYYKYMNTKLDEYEPVWVSSTGKRLF